MEAQMDAYTLIVALLTLLPENLKWGAALITALATLVWAWRRHPGGGDAGLPPCPLNEPQTDNWPPAFFVGQCAQGGRARLKDDAQVGSS